MAADDPAMDFDEQDDTEAIVQYVIEEHHEFLSWIGTTVDEVGDGAVTLSIPYDEKLSNTRPNDPSDQRADIHGGVAATLIDTAGGFCLRTAIENPFEARIATINLNVNYLRPATGDLTATADIIRAGRSVGVSEVTVESTTPDGQTREVATGQGAFRIFRPE
ncbi:PaaI family thioesterase [Salinadaptatus halalkaliphilus]|uniref:PaaI family thioesterase n=1 Tax=Salinadaptatus halalkaliphilus TaxID=2419781 RepID=A0A4S3TR43_9EURY|nr:PaaI family thioesterase [Salinadaptatus halalkaliphilus]THE66110.1 PaaI family thioesterase [Salinadaptatus halalkaliphilus]